MGVEASIYRRRRYLFHIDWFLQHRFSPFVTCNVMRAYACVSLCKHGSRRMNDYRFSNMLITFSNASVAQQCSGRASKESEKHRRYRLARREICADAVLSGT